jgi:membrane protease subunit HflC
MGARILSILIVVLAVVLLISTSTFIVGEQELAVRVRLKQIDASTFEPGLHFKAPFIDDVVKFDKRVLTKKYDGEQFLTRESQGLTIDYYIKWRIHDPARFYTATSGGDEGRAETLVGENVQDGIKNAVAGRTLKEIVNSDRQEVTGEFMDRSSASLQRLGILLVDVRVQRIDLQEEVATSVYESMKRTFEGIATLQRGEGNKRAQIVRAEADRKRTELVAKSLADAQRIRGEGEASAAAIYADAYNRDPEFYSFYRSLQAYRNSIGRDRDILVLSPDSEFFRYFKNPAPARR